ALSLPDALPISRGRSGRRAPGCRGGRRCPGATRPSDRSCAASASPARCGAKPSAHHLPMRPRPWPGSVPSIRCGPGPGVGPMVPRAPAAARTGRSARALRAGTGRCEQGRPTRHTGRAPPGPAPACRTDRPGHRSERAMTSQQRIPLADHVADATALLGAVRGREVIPLDARAVGRVAVAEQRSRIDVPGHDNSQMDGYALAADGLVAGESVTLPLGPMIAAGDAPGALEPAPPGPS